jgi:UDPglucose--hexose-1-phosphate uridylyltransferase
MSELRQDRTTGGWVIVAPQRGRRPQIHMPGEIAPKRVRFDPACPFCPGNEAQLPGIVAEAAAHGVPGWRLRVVPNKFPAVLSKPPPVAGADHQARTARGVHEVIIESPWHDAELAAMSADELNAVVGVYRGRSRILLEQDGIAAAILFRNHGRQAGASLAHPHAQIIALDIVPPKIAAAVEWGKRYHSEHGRCAQCEELAVESKSGERIVDENDAFVALAPYAAEHPFELWLAPKRHQASFTELADAALGDFAALLGRTLRRLRAALNDPPYNFVVDSAPKGELAAPYWHWRLRIVPDIATWGGFELGAGLPINQSRPEDDARLLRAAQAEIAAFEP